MLNNQSPFKIKCLPSHSTPLTTANPVLDSNSTRAGLKNANAQVNRKITQASLSLLVELGMPIIEHFNSWHGD